MVDDTFRRIIPGIETFRSTVRLPRHRHFNAYATVVLSGTLEEAGYAGRIKATAGDVIVHPSLDCHANKKAPAGLKIIRLDWPAAERGGIYRLRDSDELAKIAEKDAELATAWLIRAVAEATAAGKYNDWPDELATALARNSALRIGAWAQNAGLTSETVSRGFAAAYGVTPEGYRAELRARRAWFRVVAGKGSLAAIAADTGFADQAHMSKWIRRITGAVPSFWRDSASERDSNGLLEIVGH